MAKKQKRSQQPVQAKKKMTEQGARKTLQTLQLSGQSPLILVGSSGSRSLKRSIKGDTFMQNEATKDKDATLKKKDVFCDPEQKENLPAVLPQKLQEKFGSLCDSLIKPATSGKQAYKDGSVSDEAGTVSLDSSMITIGGIKLDENLTSSSELSNCSGTSGVNDVFELTDEKNSVEYWKALAEERRIALQEALKENESLHDQVEVLEVDNSRLLEIVNQAKTLATFLKVSLEFEENPEEKLSV